MLWGGRDLCVSASPTGDAGEPGWSAAQSGAGSSGGGEPSVSFQTLSHTVYYRERKVNMFPVLLGV